MSETNPGCLRAHALEMWRGERCLFRDMHLQVNAGEILQITGPNGCGKTSLLRVLCGLAVAESGEVLWNDRPIVRDRLGFQSALCYVAHQDGLHDDLTASENLAWGVALHGGAGETALRDMLQEMGMGESMHVKTYALSAGQKRRLALARAVLTARPLWILDEPLANLDDQARRWCEAIIAGHVADGGMVIATSHQVLCDGHPGHRQLALSV